MVSRNSFFERNGLKIEIRGIIEHSKLQSRVKLTMFCGFCGKENPPKYCKCMERGYCDADCQLHDWRSHKNECPRRRERLYARQSIYLRNNRCCGHCAKGKPPKRCPCNEENYCDEKCQKKHWKTHRKVCLVDMLNMLKNVSGVENPIENGFNKLQIALIYMKQGRLIEANSYLNDAIRQVCRAMKSPSSTRDQNYAEMLRGTLWTELGWVRYNTGQQNTALKAWEIAVQHLDSRFGCSNACSIKALIGQVDVYLQRDNLDKAFNIAQLCVSIGQKSHVKGTLNEAMALHAMGKVHEQMRGFDEAMKYYAQADRIFRCNKKDWFHASLQVNGLITIANFKRGRSEFREAESLYFMALEISKRFFGMKHSLVVRILNHVGTAMKKQGNRDDEVCLIADKSLSMTMKLFGERSPRILAPISLLTDAKMARGESTPRVISLFKHAIRVAKQDHDSQKFLLAMWYYNLAIVYRDINDVDKALRALERAYKSPIKDPEFRKMVNRDLTCARQVKQRMGVRS